MTGTERQLQLAAQPTDFFVRIPICPFSARRKLSSHLLSVFVSPSPSRHPRRHPQPQKPRAQTVPSLHDGQLCSFRRLLLSFKRIAPRRRPFDAKAKAFAAAHWKRDQTTFLVGLIVHGIVNFFNLQFYLLA